MNEVLIRLLPPDQAPGIRDGVRDLAQWRLNEVADGWGAVEPTEGAGAVYPYFKLRRLADAATSISEETWAPLRDSPAHDKGGMEARTSPSGPPTSDWAIALVAWADKIYAARRPGSEFVAIEAKLGAAPIQAVPEFLSQQVPALFETFPLGSLWFMETDGLLSRRLSLQRILLNQELIPDLFDLDQSELPALQLLQEHSLTNGASFSPLYDPLLLAFPPTTLGFAFDWMPHALVFSAGFAGMLLEGHPPTMASIYAPRLQSGYGFHWQEAAIWEDVEPGEIEVLLQWWPTRLNVIYSHALDPTNFADEAARYRPERQVAWMLTFERLVADSLVIRANPHGSGLVLQQAAFDLLDKAEVLLGYGADTGKGFQRLLRRAEMTEVLDRVWETRLPVQMQQRFKRYADHLFEKLYEQIRAEAYEHRVADDGVFVWSDPENRLIKRNWEDYLPKLIRAIRNSAHGLVEQLEAPSQHKARNIIATHSGKLPSVLPDLAALISFALIADAERLCDGSFLGD